MPDRNLIEINDQIGVIELLYSLWVGKYVILIFSVLAILLASVILRNSEKKYSVGVILKPVIETDRGPDLSGFSGLAALTGVSLPTSNSSDFTTYQKLIFSEEVAERVLVNQNLVKRLFEKEWNQVTESFEAQPLSQISKLKQLVKTVLTGTGNDLYIAPNAKRLSMLMNNAFDISIDIKTGFISMTAETAAPNTMIELFSIATQETDNLLKERFFLTAEETLDFYHQKLLTSRSPEHREALAKLILAEDQKLLLATRNVNFVAEPLTTPNVSLHPTSPKPNLVLALLLMLGILLGSSIVLIRQAFKKPRTI